MDKYMTNPFEDPGRNTPPQIRPSRMLLRMAQGTAMTQTIYAATRLGIPELIAKGIDQLDALAAETETKSEILYRLLRALASLGVFEETESERFSLTPISECMLPDNPDSVRNLILLLGEVNFGFWGNFIDSIRTGKSAVHLSQGTGYFEYLEQHIDAGTIFNRSMVESSERLCPVILESYDFSGSKQLIDVGGGSGALLKDILLKHPSSKGILFEQADALSKAEEDLAVLGDRCRLVEGDFFRDIPANGDCYLLMRVLHNWSDEDVLTILGNIRLAFAPKAKLIIVERCLTEHPEWIMQVSDLTMLLLFGTKERTVMEFDHLLKQSGFAITEAISTKSPVTIIEAGIA